MPLRTAVAAIALVAFAPSLEPVQSPELDTTTIVHLTVGDLSTGKELPDQTMVFEGDPIVSVGSENSGRLPLRPGRAQPGSKTQFVSTVLARARTIFLLFLSEN